MPIQIIPDPKSDFYFDECNSRLESSSDADVDLDDTFSCASVEKNSSVSETFLTPEMMKNSSTSGFGPDFVAYEQNYFDFYLPENGFENSGDGRCHFPDWKRSQESVISNDEESSDRLIQISHEIGFIFESTS